MITNRSFIRTGTHAMLAVVYLLAPNPRPLVAQTNSEISGNGQISVGPQSASDVTLYWTDNSTNMIQRSVEGAALVEDLVTTGLSTPVAVTLDLMGGKLYWADQQAYTVGRANLDGSSAEDIVSTASRDFTHPLGVAVDPGGGHVYWTEWCDSGCAVSTVRRANLDGSSMEILIDTNILFPTGIALDIDAGKMYWADGEIFRANTNGSGRQTLVGAAAFDEQAWDIELDIDAGHIYWAEKNGPVKRANLADGSDVQTIVASPGTHGGIALDLISRTVYWSSHADDGGIYRANLDGSNAQLVQDAPHEPVGLALEATPADCNNNGTPDVDDIADGDSLDCNENGIPDECEVDCNCNGVDDAIDIENGTSDDCNDDGSPDECEPGTDCNDNSVPDECETDCNCNGVDDAADINSGGSFDDNADGVPDECCVSPAPLFVEPLKSRFLSLESVGTPGVMHAIRVLPVTLPEYGAFEGLPLWVGPPREYWDLDWDNLPARKFIGAALQCMPHYHDWSTIDVLDVYGGEIIPQATYDVQLINDGCPVSFETNYSVALDATTGKWGDIVAPFQSPGVPHPSFGDIASIVEKFLEEPGAPVKARAHLVPNYVFLDRLVDFRSIAAVISAFLGIPYSQTNGITGPCACPSAVTCNAAPCALDAECAANGYCLDGFCTDACGRCSP